MNIADLWREAVTLTGNVVRLEPMKKKNIPELAIAGRDERIWKYLLYANLTSYESMAEWVKDLLGRRRVGTDLPFVVFHKTSGKIVGATRYLEMRQEHRSLEIGGTWYAPEFQRTAVNTESKYLLLKYAFEDLGCIRVQFKTDSRNIASINAIERLGAIREGVFRNHFILQDGTFRDSIFFSIIQDEWPHIKRRLEEKLKLKY